MRIATSASRGATAAGAAILPTMGELHEKALTTAYDIGKEFTLHELLGWFIEAAS
jgi:hypothetical protein